MQDELLEDAVCSHSVSQAHCLGTVIVGRVLFLTWRRTGTPRLSAHLQHVLASPAKWIGAALLCCTGQAGGLHAACKPEAVGHPPAAAQHNQPSREACASGLSNISRVPLSWQPSPLHARPQHPTTLTCMPQRSWGAA